MTFAGGTVAQALTVIVPIKAGEVSALRQLLHDMGHDVMNNPHVHFSRSHLVHFARFVILPDTMPAETDLTPHLLFSSNFDGDLDTYLDELIQLSPGMDLIWGRCEGYTGVDNFHRFIRDHSYEPSAFFQAFRDETSARIRQYITLRDRIESLLDANKPVAQMLNSLLSIPYARPVPVWQRVLNGIIQIPLRIVSPILQLLGNAVGWVLRRLLFPEWKDLNAHSAIEIQLKRTPEDIQHIQTLAAFEDLVVQNQMNILSEVKPGHIGALKRILGFIEIAARTSPPGSLSGIQTIHFARWVLFDNDRRLLFLSNYDGTWENYIGDFVNELSHGLNAVWCHTVDFPETGPPDIAAFHEHIRTHQIRSQVFYSAYPTQTVRNILDNRQIASVLREGIDHPGLTDALRRL